MKKAVVLALAAIMVLGVVGAAFADAVPYPGAVNGDGDLEATNGASPVQVTASVKSKLTLTVDTPDGSQTAAFGDVYPGAAAVTEDVDVTVQSNKSWTSSTSVAGQDALMGLSRAGFPASGAKGANTYTDTYTVNVPWTTDPGDYTATVTYTVTQD
ncbi:MAG: hypothetical protein Q7W51_10755 [Coriobacteriia bacterium]|nr:hypothetical protein [Coriobacteriia bacterium]